MAYLIDRAIVLGVSAAAYDPPSLAVIDALMGAPYPSWPEPLRRVLRRCTELR